MRRRDVRARARPQLDQPVRGELTQRGKHDALVHVELLGERARARQPLAAVVPAEVQPADDTLAQRLGDLATSESRHGAECTTVRRYWAICCTSNTTGPDDALRFRRPAARRRRLW